jgi:L-asparagine oxygenase
VQIAFVFEDREKNNIISSLLEINVNPYTEYKAFSAAVNDLATSGVMPKRFANFCESRKEIDLFDNPYVLMENCPLDPVIPYLDFDEPVLDKRANKKTFVAEGFLQLYSVLMDQIPIGYISINDGDVFHDIHPKRDLAEAQSQKALNALNFHKDLGNHHVRPEWVNIMGIRNNRKNEIFTCFVSNKDLLAALDKDTKLVLREEEYLTPYSEVLTLASNSPAVGEAPKHTILGGDTEYHIRFFEKRTIGLTDRANAAVKKLTETLHKLKEPVFVDAGTFIGSANNECMHNKEVRNVADPEDAKNRWLMKTLSVASLDAHEQHMMAGSQHIVASGERIEP